MPRFSFSDKGRGYYEIEVNAGTAIGAITIELNPENIPKGMRVLYDGVYYNKFSSSAYGLLESGTAGNFTIMGKTASTCSNMAEPTGHMLDKYLFSGSSFVDSGVNQSVILDPSDVQTTVDNPSTCHIVIPKTSASPSNIVIQIAVPCNEDKQDFSFLAGCPTKLTGFSGTKPQSTALIACADSQTETYYIVKVNGVSSLPEVHDLIFTDEDGLNYVSDGYINFGVNRVSQIQDGVIISEGSC
ncbi:MAG: hypothetical protein Unbinned1473contig1000_8 [Prokaryotic dsDNA virus sp.]|nr:MAG: hypothetical protein Unbinned1473contig1000_8 [Prokaryotic dsDNA virus sp.]